MIADKSELLELKVVADVQKPVEEDASGDLSKNLAESIWSISFQSIGVQDETTKPLKLDSRKIKLEWPCFDCYDFLGWHQGLMKS